MESQPCKVCGGTDLNLVDGYYYCVECGTQDVDVRETIIEKTFLADGTLAHSAVKKVPKVLKESLDMSGEWKKWHAYNFILVGLTEELLALGAKPSVRMVVLWIWVKYIKMFQDKEALSNKPKFEDDVLEESRKEQKEDDASDTEGTDSDDKPNKSKSRKKKQKEGEIKYRRDIKVITKGTLLAILYVALNLDRSDIQISHLFRFIKEGRLSIMNCTKFVPKEINIKTIPQWKNFIVCIQEYTPKRIRELAMTIFKRLDLGVPLVPDLTNMVHNFVTELCLPNDFKHLVLSLMNLVPFDFLKLDTRSKKTQVRIPDYEVVCMSYVLIALKMCFGLDGDYELKLSDEVDRINCQDNRQKSYKLGFYSDNSERLFSFREWSQFLQFRKIVLCKNYLPMSHIYNLPVDDCVFMEHLEERSYKKKRLRDEVTMDILNKITVDNDVMVISKEQFPVTFRPMTTYTEIISDHIKDPDFKLLLCEDFSQYSLKYAIEELNLAESYNDSINLIKGVNESNKTFNPFVIGTLESKKGDKTMVFVRNCENENWLKTKPPSLEHVSKIRANKKNSEKENDSTSGYDSNSECTPILSNEVDNIANEDLGLEKILETFEEEYEGIQIFDDDFLDVDEHMQNEHVEDSKVDLHESFDEVMSDDNSLSKSDNIPRFDPETFDRNKVIQELIEIACRQYNIPVPKEKTKQDGPKRDRKRNLENNEALQNEAKKRKTDRKESKMECQRIIESYYENIKNDVLHQISDNVRSLVHSLNMGIKQNETCIPNLVEEQNESHQDNDASVISIPPNFTDNNCNDDVEDDEEETIEEVLSNPKFDPKTHDIKQLYLKLKEDQFKKETFDFADPEIDKLIEQKIKEFASNEQVPEVDLEDDSERHNDTSDSEDDVPLKELRDEKMIRLEKQRRKKIRLEKLVMNKNVNDFCYWVRHYKSRPFVRSADMTKKFDVELLENLPISFVFVIRECAAVLNCTTFCLYKCMQNLEHTLLIYNDA